MTAAGSMRSGKRRRLRAAVGATALAGVGLLAAPPMTVGTTGASVPTPPPLVAGATHTTRSANFSGYLLSGSILLRQIHASWHVSTVGTANNGWSYTWIGSGGSTTGASVIQVGTAEYVEKHRAYYMGWWWTTGPGIKSTPLHVAKFSVRPGDRISASITQLTTHRWKVTLSNVTTHRTMTAHTWWYAHGRGVEYVIENPPQSQPWPDWHHLTFADCYYNHRGARLNRTERWEVHTSKGLLDRVTLPSRTRRGFSATWLRP